MDLRIYYQKIRETEARIRDPYPVVKSLETPDGGREGTLTEVPKRLAAKLIVDGHAIIASTEEALAFLEQQAQAKRAVDEAAASAKIQVAVVSTEELNRLRNQPGTAAE